MAGPYPGCSVVAVEVDSRGAGERADRYLSARIGAGSRSQFRLRLAEIRVNGRLVKPGARLAIDDRVDAVLKPPPATVVLPEPVPLAVLHEDDDVVVVDKPSGMVVHPGSGNHTGTLVNALLYRYDNLAEQFPDSPRPGIVHRLDKGTSGVIIIAKHAGAHAHLASQFSARRVDKRYLAWVAGRPIPGAGRIATRLRRDPANPLCVRISTERGKVAVTRYRVRATARGASLVALRPLTGRTHQLRAHMRWLGHPILGDPLYAGRAKGTAPRLLLHAHRLAITLPGATERATFEAPPPRDFALPG